MTSGADRLRVNAMLVLQPDDLEWSFQTSGGAGGQHANRARTRVDLSFDVARSASLSEGQRARLQAELGDVVRVTAGDERSQSRNREVALERMRSKLAAALHQERPRRATAPSRASRQRRLDAKRQRSDVKRGRRRPRGDDV